MSFIFAFKRAAKLDDPNLDLFDDKPQINGEEKMSPEILREHNKLSVVQENENFCSIKVEVFVNQNKLE